MGEFRMPSLGADMDVGTIVEWLVKPGDAVRRGQIVAVVDTAKAAIEIEAFEEGVVTEILVGTGVQVAVGTPLAMIGASSSAAVSLIPSTERTESMTQASEAAPTGHSRRRPKPFEHGQQALLAPLVASPQPIDQEINFLPDTPARWDLAPNAKPHQQTIDVKYVPAEIDQAA